MTDNFFTPLKNSKSSSLFYKKKFDIFKIISYVFFIFSFGFFFINTFIPNLLLLLNNFSQKTKATSQTNLQIYKYKFQTINELNFIPKKINNLTINKEEIYQYFKNKYDSLSESNLIKLINKKIFSYIVLNDNTNLNLLTNFNGSSFEEELEKLINSYQAETKKITFYYFKTRFQGTREENLSNLNINVNSIKNFAHNKINYYHKLNLSPDDLMNQINNDEEVSLLNNNEKSAEKIENYDYNTPIFDDPEFYNLLTNSQINKYSDIYTLKTINPNSSNYEDYLFVFFFVEKIEGEKIPLEIAINNFITQSEIF